jgi:hexosaminidase
MKDLLGDLVPRPRAGRMMKGRLRWKEASVHRCQSQGFAPEGYSLLVEPEGISIMASTDAGFFRAEQTLHQLRRLTKVTCPCLSIEDEPRFRVRGYMLDISRCKVPRMDHLFRMVDLLALFKYNQLQLYTEHTFAYAGHERVWQEASPMTADEIRELDDYCAARHIELVPNQNTLGHMERWLRHPEYHHLAESPDGFHHPVSGWRPNGSVLCPGDDSTRFIKGLLDQLLPCFRSGQVHVGCDEPWELGRGRSEGRVDQSGRHAVYRDHLLALHGILSGKGKRMLFWSDELREDPLRIIGLPRDVIPVVWGYEADHPFDEECAVYSDNDYQFLVAPGDGSWNSHCGRLGIAARNIQRAAQAALDHGAEGMLLTSWGDNGHQQVWPAQLPGLILFAAAAWNQENDLPVPVAGSLDRLVFLDEKEMLGTLWERFAKLDSLIPVAINPRNTSFTFDALFESPDRVRRAFRGHSSDDLFPALKEVEHCQRLLTRAGPACIDADWILRETGLALELALAGLRRASAIAQGHEPVENAQTWKVLLEEYPRLWLLRNRSGGLEESLQLLERARV